MIYTRFIQESLRSALLDTPCVLLTGPRQSGKTTLVSQWDDSATNVSFDNWSFVNQAKNDPEGFVERLVINNPGQLIVMDEIQHVPELSLPIKRMIDTHRRPGMFLLTGSANLLSWSKTPDSLAGRVEYIPLYPLSALEITGNEHYWIRELFDTSSRLFQTAQVSRKYGEKDNIDQFIFKGGFPDAFKRDDLKRRLSWFEAYLKSLLEKDVYDISSVEQPLLLRNILNHLAYRCGSTINFTDLAISLQSTQITVKKYYNLLQMIYLISPLQAWHRNLGKRLVKSPKVYFIDSGLLANLLSSDPSDLQKKGILLEQFVFNELQKQISWVDPTLKLYYWRTTDGKEVDFILENRQNMVVGIEVKSKSTLTRSDWSSLGFLEREVGENFVRGIVLYRGEQILSLSPKIWAVPISWISQVIR